MSFPKQLGELKPLKQWVAYRLVWNEKKGKADKRPINPHDGTGAKANDPATWGTLQEAQTALRTGNFDGLGFEFGNFPAGTLRVSGIDLDHVIHEDGTLEPFAAEIVKLMRSYTEYSLSGTWIHILCKTKNKGHWTQKRYKYIKRN